MSFPVPVPVVPRRILLAPMEGVLDHSLRDVLTRVGGIDRCVSEFIRITDQLLPPRVFTRLMPELLDGGRTPAGVPVRGQLLGGDPACLADNAARLAELGSPGVDLNFGCPARIVNRNRGGAVLLDEPELVHAIVAAVRRAVPTGVPVSAKMRLGHHDESRMLDNARAIGEAGADELVVHARTRAQGYRPPAFWDRIARIRDAVAMPVVANGEVWNVDDARRCLAESGCDALMLGRGLVADPGLARVLRGEPAPGWPELLTLVLRYARLVAQRLEPRHRAGRVKQWLNYLRRRHPQAQQAYDALREVRDSAAVERWLEQAVGDGESRASPLPQAMPAGWTPREPVAGEAESRASPLPQDAPAVRTLRAAVAGAHQSRASPLPQAMPAGWTPREPVAGEAPSRASPLPQDAPAVRTLRDPAAGLAAGAAAGVAADLAAGLAEIT